MFDIPDVEHVEERHGELGTPASGYFLERGVIEHCPKCGETNFKTGAPCPICGEFAEDDFCEDCYYKVTEAVEALEQDLGTTWQHTVDIVGAWYERNF